MPMIRNSTIARVSVRMVITIITLRGVMIGSDSLSMICAGICAGAAWTISTQRAPRGDCAGSISTQRSSHDVRTGSSSAGNICDIDSCHLG